MIRVYGIEESVLWDDIVRGFAQYDVYYLSGYVKAFQIHGDGYPQLLYYEADGLKAIYVFMKRETAIDGYFDSVTPYGYGGVLFEGDVSEDNLRVFWNAYVGMMKEIGVVDNFVRYHPLLANAHIMKCVSNVTDLGKTVAIDISSPEVIWKNLTSKNRNMIRKAEKNGIEIRHGKDFALFNDFMRIYNATMEKDHAEDYYFFGNAFYESIYNDLHDNYEMFYAVLNGEIIAMSIILYANNRMHYHLSGSVYEYRCLAPTNLLLYKAALWGCERGFKVFHLGGGVASEEDNLFKFKAAFNRQSDCRYSIGKEIYDQNKYDELINERSKQDVFFDRESSYFPLYRAEMEKCKIKGSVSMKNILISSAGQRVVLVQIFQKTIKQLGLDIKVYASDVNPLLAPARYVADDSFAVSGCNEEHYVDELFNLCKEKEIGLIIPTIDTELTVFAANRKRFEDAGIVFAEPDWDFIKICRDKRLTSSYFSQIGISVPKLIDINHPVFPMFAKPYDGSRSINTHVIMSQDDLTKEITSDPKLIFLEYVNRQEYREFTVDMYYGRDFRVKCIVPRERLKVREGEVSKGITRKNYIVDFLKERMGYVEGVRGCICIQLFYRESDNDIKGIEINPRFGGGFPLSYYAKANFVEYLIREYLLGESIDYSEDWLDRTLMLRYDENVIVNEFDS